ncbi:glycosyltransferase family 2 protein [Euzebya tangerina]|uniref:glycosyltransferase family 2 protein n=1 Tax=Euzebya tangerina TaxID=591198 RepID=UPI0013C2E9C8|nr:glycosyltransferase family A protein [Euzebya tangerina]
MAHTVSCVIPTYARATQLDDAVEAARAQTHMPAEVIVVDDGPQDASARQPVRDWAGSPLVVVVDNPDGQGASSARNTGAERASGSLLAFLDDDDRWDPTYLARALDRLESADVDLVVTWAWLCFEDGTRLPGPAMPEGLTVADVVAINPGLTGSNLVITRSAFDQIGGFDPALTVSNDKDLLVRFLDAGLRYAVVEDRLVRKTEHERDRLTRPSLARVAALGAYERKHADRLSRRQRWQLRAKRARVRRRAAESLLDRSRATGVLLVCLILGGPVEGLPRALQRLLAGQRSAPGQEG